MATGAGKTFLAANVAYRLVRYADARRVLFLVDRATLGAQALGEFQSFAVPGDGRKFTELYNVQHLSSSTVDKASRVTISTIQRLYAALRGEDLDPELDESSAAELEPAGTPVPVAYNAAVPPETFDIVIVDEAHRSIFGVWRQVLDYFDAYLIGLTATPSKQTLGFFHQNLVMEYGHAQAVVDKVNVDFSVYRIRTEITEQGSTVEAGLVTGFRDRQTRALRWEQLDDDVSYGAEALDRAVVAEDQIRTVIETFRDRLFTEIFPGRTDVPKTLIFAKDDSHADDIVRILREEFGKGDEFAQKITYRTTGRKPEEVLKSFRNSYFPRIAVTVDMIATGTDVKPLECVFFMRAVRSRTYFEQMKGRGVRVISADDLQAVTPDAAAKDRFVIVDAVGVTEKRPGRHCPARPQADRSAREAAEAAFVREPRPGGGGDDRGPDRARLERRLTPADRQELFEALAGTSLQSLTHGIVAALDPDRRLEAAELEFGLAPTGEQVAAAGAQPARPEAVAPLADNPELRQRLVDIRRSYDQLLDEVSADTLIAACGYSADAADPGALDRRLVPRVHRGALRRDHGAAAPSTAGPVSARVTYAQIKELRRGDRAPAARAGRPSGCGLPTRRSRPRASTARGTGS